MPKFPKEPYEGQIYYEPFNANELIDLDDPMRGKSWIYEKGQWVDISNQEVKSED